MAPKGAADRSAPVQYNSESAVLINASISAFGRNEFRNASLTRRFCIDGGNEGGAALGDDESTPIGPAVELLIDAADKQIDWMMRKHATS